MLIAERVIEILVWPAVVFVLGVTGLVMFRSQVRQFLGRTQSVGKGWLVASPPEQQLSTVQSDKVREFLDSFGGELLTAQEKSIRDDLSTRQVASPADTERILVRALAATQMALHFEQIHSVIWDGQIQLLETLNGLPTGAELAAIGKVYDEEFRAKRPFYADIDFETYLAWLLEKTLVRIDDGRIGLTVAGRELLKWMIDNGKQKRGVG